MERERILIDPLNGSMNSINFIENFCYGEVEYQMKDFGAR